MKLHLMLGTLTMWLPSLLLADPILNPAGIAIGDTATYWISLQPSSFPDDLIEWSGTPAGRVSFPQGNTGRVVTVRGESAGDVLLRPTITGVPELTPAFQIQVVTSSVVNAHVYIICASDGTPAISSNDVSSMFEMANDIWRQVGVSFQVVETQFVTNGDWLVVEKIDGNWQPFQAITAYTNGTGGMECYFVESILGSYGLNSTNGLVMASSCPLPMLAHELGHACGLKDIYVSHSDTQLGVSGHISRNSLGTEWGSESDIGYYSVWSEQAKVIPNLLMCGKGTSNNKDITYGDILGLWKSNRIETNTVVNDWYLSPAPIGFFLHGTQHPAHH